MDIKPQTLSLGTGELWMSRQRPEADTELTFLIERATTGDRAAFGELVLRHERRILTLAWRMLGTMEDAQDAAQEVFLRAFKYLRGFDTSKLFEPWLVGMTVNVCRAHGRKRQQQRSVFIHAPEVEPLDPDRDPHDELNAGQQRQILYRALDRLPEKERTALILRDIEGLSTAEVAEILGSSEGTVRVQVSSARLKIRKSIESTKGGRR